ncbi:hypothetical protein OAD67_02710 [bacterium]|nr:hypothetical protein [bacterium]
MLSVRRGTAVFNTEGSPAETAAVGEELVGAADAAAARESQQRARPPSPGRRTRVDEKDSPPHYLGSNYY